MGTNFSDVIWERVFFYENSSALKHSTIVKVY